MKVPSSRTPSAPAQPLSRRHFIESSLAGSVAGALAVWGPRAPRAPGGERPRAGARPAAAAAPFSYTAPGRIPLHAAVLDERFAEGVAFGQAARDYGLPTRALRGDVTDLWYRELYPLWKERAAPLAGLTAYAALFCLEQLAWDHRLRVIYRAAHRVLANGAVEHLVSAPEEIAVPALRQAPADWPRDLASMMARIESERGWTQLPPAQRPLERAHAGADAVVSLYSWVIARPGHMGSGAAQ
jgi:hypothetical protein